MSVSMTGRRLGYRRIRDPVVDILSSKFALAPADGAVSIKASNS